MTEDQVRKNILKELTKTRQGRMGQCNGVGQYDKKEIKKWGSLSYITRVDAVCISSMDSDSKTNVSSQKYIKIVKK